MVTVLVRVFNLVVSVLDRSCYCSIFGHVLASVVGDAFVVVVIIVIVRALVLAFDIARLL